MTVTPLCSTTSTVLVTHCFETSASNNHKMTLIVKCETDRKSEYNQVKQTGFLVNRLKSQYITVVFARA